MRLPTRLVIPNWVRPFRDIEYLLAAILILCVYGEAYPYGIPLVLPLTAAGFLWFALIHRSLSLPTHAGFALMAVSFSLYVLGVLHTSHVYETNWRDLRSAVCVLMVGVLLFSGRSRFQGFRDKAQIGGAVAGSILAMVGLYKFDLMAKGQIIRLIWVEGYPYSWGTSLIDDYNFYAFAVLCGAISCLFCLVRCPSVSAKAVCVIGFTLNSAAMLLSGSRRAWLTEILMFAVISFLVLRSIVLGLWQLAAGMRVSKSAVKTFAAIAIVAAISTFLVNRYRPDFLERNRRGLQVGIGIKDLELRFNTLRDPGESFGARISRWNFAAQLLDHAPPSELLFGGGFDYLPEFGRTFDTIQKDTGASASIEDYPHNPLISAALYSGIPGSLVVLFFLGLALFRYIRQRKIDTYFLILYFASLCFVLPAYDSIFSGKFFGFLLLIPWSMPEPMTSALHPTMSRDATIKAELKRVICVQRDHAKQTASQF